MLPSRLPYRVLAFRFFLYFRVASLYGDDPRTPPTPHRARCKKPLKLEAPAATANVEFLFHIDTTTTTNDILVVPTGTARTTA